MDQDTDGYDEIACGAGPDPDAGSDLRAFDYDDSELTPNARLALDVFGLSYGVTVSGAWTGF
jgi:hypothetical protein